MGDKTYSTLVDYYKQNCFNPVPIGIENYSQWQDHVAKRRNLYQRHLGIPFSFLRDRSVLEFGCNSGENALVLAMFGANLTLVEPNEQVFPRLEALFKQFGLRDRIREILCEDIAGFQSNVGFDLVIAEGFLYTIPNRDEMFLKIASHLIQGGLGVVSYNDRFGMFFEMVKRMILWRACELSGVEVHSTESLNLAARLFGADFKKIKASRPFQVWWKDTLVNPFIKTECLWSCQDLLPLLDSAGCEFYSSSPAWASIDQFRWYKNTLSTEERHERLLKNWAHTFPFFLTGMEISAGCPEITPGAIHSVAILIEQISRYTEGFKTPFEAISLPVELTEYFDRSGNKQLMELGAQIGNLFETAKSSDLVGMLDCYESSVLLRSLWGAAYHYICFQKIY